MNASYSCFSGDWNSFKNKIVIEGVQDKELAKTDFPEAVFCQGLKSAVTSPDYKFYTPTCFDGTTVTLEREIAKSTPHEICRNDFCFNYVNSAEQYKYWVDVPAAVAEHGFPTPDIKALQEILNKIGNTFCATTGSNEINHARFY